MEMATAGSPATNSNRTTLRGKRVLLTGGTTGIGLALLQLLARQGARILTFGRDEKALESAVARVLKEGGDVHGLAADASRLDDIRRVFREVDDRLGGLDVLINNAAVSGGAFSEQPLEEIEYVVRSNVIGYLAIAHEAVVRMQRQSSGHILLVGSMSADLREPSGSTYVATKAAIQAFAESLRKTVNEEGIRVTLLEPGKVATDMVEMSDEEKEEQISQEKMLEPDDVAAAIQFALMQPKRCDVVTIALRPHRQTI